MRLLLALTCALPLAGQPASPTPSLNSSARHSSEGATAAQPSTLNSASLPLYAITFTTGPNWDAAKPAAEQRFFKEHSASLARLRAGNFAVLGGRYADKGLLLVRAPSEAAVRTELAKDPSLAAGTFAAAVDEYRPFFHGDTRPPATWSEIAVVRAANAAFNAHDPDKLTALYADDIKWLGIDSDKISVEGERRDAMREWLANYFKTTPGVRSEISDFAQTGTLVSFRERTSWIAKDGSHRAQTALATYEIRQGKIKRAWYFPAAPEPAPPSPKSEVKSPN